MQPSQQPKKHGIAANDFVNVSGATLNLTADEDGIHSDNEDDVLLGNVYLVNTNITVNAGDDGINASNTLLIDEVQPSMYKRVKKVLRLD